MQERTMTEKAIIVDQGKGSNGTRTAPLGELPAAVGTGLVSVLIPCCGGLEYTKLCVPSLLRHSRPPTELIFLDIGSLDGTAEYLAGIQAAAQVRVEVVRAATDLDIGRTCAQALQQARGEFLVLLNNDCIVPAGWLNQLIALASMSFGTGLVGPMSNYAAPPQLVETVPYRVGPKKGSRMRGGAGEWLVETEAVHAFAKEFREQHKGKWVEAERLGGFCLLLKRAVLDRIGPLDEKGLGLFDTDVLSIKARRAGYSLAVCRDLFVHHFGTRTFAHGASPEAAPTTPGAPSA
jgi:GT2 family glycosyltransferase